MEMEAEKRETEGPEAPPSAPEGATIVSPLNGKTIEAPPGTVGGASWALMGLLLNSKSTRSNRIILAYVLQVDEGLVAVLLYQLHA